MSKCGICGNEILTGDIHWAIGICNNCYNKLYKSDERKYIDMLHKETGCIERTERLELPTWEEFDKKGYIEFVGKEATKLILEKTLTIDYDREPISYYVLEILIDDYNHTLLFKAEYTKENYTLACRKAKELFLGENK